MAQQIDKPANPDAGSDASWRTTTFTYDGLGRRITMTNPENNVTSYSYDGLGRLETQVADAGVGGIAQTTVYGYDRLGRQTSITGYADGATAQTTLYVHDRLGRVVWVMYPDVEYLCFGYNEGGKVIERTDQMDNKTTYSYDQMGRMEARRYYSVAGYFLADPNNPGGDPLDGTPLYANDPNVIETFSYDGMGRMFTAQKTQEGSVISDTQYDYSDLGSVETIEETHFGGTTQQIVCGYDQWGNQDELTYPDDGSITLTVDARGRIAAINRSATTLVSYNYVGGRVSRRTYPVGGSDDVIYDISYNNSGWATRHYTYQGATAIADFGYTHDDNGNITEIAYGHRASDPCQIYGYDDLDRLTSADYFAGYATGDEAFEYDKVGNRLEVDQGQTTQNYTVDNLTNQYTAIDAQSITYDDAGNLTADHRGYTYSYDYENRLIKVQEGANVVAEFAYDALGRRIRKIDHATNVTTLYYYKGWQVLTEMADDGQDETRYDYAYGNYLDEVLLRTTNGTTDYYLAHDHLYSPVALLEDDGDVIERYEYNAYGERVALNPTTFAQQIPSANAPVIAFTGQRVDVLDGGDLEVMYYKNRYYDPETGRFLNRDPIGYANGMSLYEYVSSDPIGSGDPLGLWGRDIHYVLTYHLARLAGIACAKDVAKGTERPDTDDREPGKKVLEIVKFGPYTGLSVRKAEAIAYWHFPISSDGEVYPNSIASQSEIKLGLANCDFRQFSEGLHRFQDSWAHQGKPYISPYGYPMGHHRGACKIYDGNGNVIGYYDCSGAAEAALSGSTDVAELWPEDIVSLGLRTYQYLQAFAKRCPCACPGGKATSNGPAMSEDEIRAYLQKRHPGDNVKTQPKPPYAPDLL